MKRLTVSVGLVVLLSVSVWADYLELSRGALLKAAPSANAETKEQLGGFFLVECKNVDEAIDLATKIPGAQTGAIEVRPVVERPAEPHP